MPKRDTTIIHRHLLGILPEDTQLSVTSGGFVSILCNNEMIGYCHLSTIELALFLQLVEDYPDFSTYTDLFTIYMYTNPTEKQIAKIRHDFAEMDSVTRQEKMAPLRNVLSSLRQKIADIDMSISAIMDTGYLLQHVASRRQRR